MRRLSDLKYLFPLPQNGILEFVCLFADGGKSIGGIESEEGNVAQTKRKTQTRRRKTTAGRKTAAKRGQKGSAKRAEEERMEPALKKELVIFAGLAVQLRLDI